MKTRVRRAVLLTMDWVCAGIDGLPNWTWRIPLLHRLGCPRGLALWSSYLDEHWKTGCWTPKNTQRMLDAIKRLENGQGQVHDLIEP